MIKYTIINPYYITDNKGKKYNHEQTCKILNHQQRIITMKTELIKQLIGTNNALTNTIKQLQEEKNTQRGQEHEKNKPKKRKTPHIKNN